MAEFYTQFNSSELNKVGYENVKIYFNYKSIPDIATNSSRVQVDIYLAVNEGVDSLNQAIYTVAQNDTYGSSYNYVIIDGTKYTYTLQKYSGVNNNYGKARHKLGSVTSNSLKHNSDGTKRITIQPSVPFKLINSYTYDTYNYRGNITSISLDLDKIVQVSTITCPTTYIGETAKISISKPSASFTDTITYTFGSLTGTVVEKTSAASIDWVIPESFYTVIPNATSGKGTLIVQTFDTNGTSLGTKSISFTALVKEETNKPVINDFIVKNVNDEITALTGDTGTIIKGEGMIEYQADVITKNSATIKEQYIQNGSKKIEGLAQGVIDDVENGVFTFTVVDSRGFTTTATLEKTIIEYLKPTCYQEVEAELSGETSAIVKLKVYGSYFNDTFGAVANTLKLEVRHTQNDGTMGDWVDLTDGLIPVFDGNSYSLDVTISGFDYRIAYEFQCRATDKLNTVQSASYTVKILPVFDWSETDINFNVPIGMNNAGTVLRHNAEANNTVLSGTGGHIYLRPNGTDDTVGETVIYPDGSIKFGGSVSFDGAKSDFVIEYGTESMGSNGTWHWEKWASGKAVCYGRRNFGKASCTTSFRGGYRSAYYEQAFPTDLFVGDLLYSNAVTTGYEDTSELYYSVLKGSTNKEHMYFYLHATSSGTLPVSYVDFHAVGYWKTDDSGEDEGGGETEGFTGEKVGTVTTITRDSSGTITHLGIDEEDGNGETIYPCIDGVTHQNLTGSGFSTGISVRITLENGYITHFTF